jgi:hypothetical protein
MNISRHARFALSGAQVEAKPKVPGKVFRTVFSVCIIAYAFALLVQMGPESPPRNRLIKLVSPVLDYPALWQNFAVFSPEPRESNIYISAVVTFADGSSQYFAYPRLDRLSLWDRMQKERYRKYALDNVYKDDDRGLWPDMARYVARLFYHAGRKPIAVSLQRNFSDIPAPEKGIGKPLPVGYDSATFFVYYVKPEDLQ